MNWFVNGSVKLLNEEERKDSDECEHVTENRELEFGYNMEKDSFGIVGCIVNCKDCYERTIIEDKMNNCDDCGEYKITDTWKPYDYMRGEEALTICDDCWEKPKHKQRVKEDRALVDKELDHLDEEDYMD